MKFHTALRIQPGDIITLIDDQPATMLHLGRELGQADQRVLLVTAAPMLPTLALDPLPVIRFDPDNQTVEALAAQLQQSLNRFNQLVLAVDQTDAQVKAVPDLIDKLAEIRLFDAIIYAANLWPTLTHAALQLPQEIPARTTLLVPIINQVLVNRLNLNALLSSLPTAMRVIPLLNNFNAADSAMVQKVARQLLKETPVEAVAIGASDEESSIVRVENRVAAIVLAAGRASRFGSPKQLALWQDKPLLAHVVDAALASQAEPVIVVLGAHAEACRSVLADRPVQIVMNDQWAAGQSTSMRAGLAALPSTVSAALFPLADQPFVTPAVINTLIAAYQQTLKPVVWPEFEGRRGNPVLFDRILFPEMNRISGDTGAKPVLMAHQAEAERVVVTEPGILQDIDRPEDL
jgi:molybdenum cofactor cytidylyltransferase